MPESLKSPGADVVNPIFGQALERPEPAARAAFLAEACGGDAALRTEVEGLLATAGWAGDLLRPGPATDDATGAFRPDSPPTLTDVGAAPTADFPDQG